MSLAGWRNPGDARVPPSLSRTRRPLLIRALVFDFDGLILDTETPLYESWAEIYRDCGLDVPLDEWTRMIGTTADPPAAYEFLERHLGRSIDRGAIRARREKRESELLANELPLPGVRALLEAAREARLLLAVASSSDRAWVRGHLERFHLLSLFRTIACADDVEKTKPSPDLYITALARLEVAAEEAVAFEDSPHGVSAAKRAGIFCVAVPNRVTRGGDFASADMVIPSLSGVALADITRAASAE